MNKNGIDICGKGSFSKGHPCHSDRGSYPSAHGNSKGGGGSYSSSQGSQTAQGSHGSSSMLSQEIFSLPKHINNPFVPKMIGHNFSPHHVKIFDTYLMQKYGGISSVQKLVIVGTNYVPDRWQLECINPPPSVNSAMKNAVQNLQFFYVSGKTEEYLANIKVITLTDNKINDFDLSHIQKMCYIYRMKFSLDGLYLQNNHITDLGIKVLLNAYVVDSSLELMISPDLLQRIVQENIKGFINDPIRRILEINLSNNQIGDNGAKLISDSLAKGEMLATKVLDVSGNQITKTGVGYFLDALKNSNVGNIIIKQYHLSVFGNKENKVSFMKDYLKQAQDKGVDVKNIIVDKSLTGYIKTTSKVVKDVAVGFAKCYYVDDAVTDYAADKIIAKVSKTFGMFWNGKDVVNCYAESFDDVMVSEVGVELIKSDLEIMGEAIFINAIE